MDAIAELITAPVQPWDALICTSRAVQNNVRRILEAEAEYLRRRLGTTKILLPELPIIPLGCMLKTLSALNHLSYKLARD